MSRPMVLPFVLVIGLMVIAQSSARTHEHEKDDHRIHLQRRKTGGSKNKPSLPLVAGFPVSTPALSELSKKLYAELGRSAATNGTLMDALSSEFQDDFHKLNASTDGKLGQVLHSVFELRLLDTQASVRHARQMLDLVQLLVPN